MLFRRPGRIGRLIRQADEAQRLRDWSVALRCYEAIVEKQPHNFDIWIQLGHAAKEARECDRAEQAYRHASGIAPEKAEPHLQLGHLFKAQGAHRRAHMAFADALSLDPKLETPLAELIDAGARDAVPDAVFDVSLRDDAARDLDDAQRAVERALKRQAALETYPLQRYDAFRRAFPIGAPPSDLSPAPGAVLFVVDARGAAPYYIRATLLSLIGQEHPEWCALVIAEPATMDHPVGSFAATDARIRFGFDTDAVKPADAAWIFSLPAGVVLDRLALRWHLVAAALADADAVFADHDVALDDPQKGRSYLDPTLHGAFDPDVLVQTALPPPAILFKSTWFDRRRAPVPDSSPVEAHRKLLLLVGGQGRIAHVPLFLVSVLELPERARHAPQGDDGGAPSIAIAVEQPRPGTRYAFRDGLIELRECSAGAPVTIAPMRSAATPLRVIIPTRDEPESLRIAVDSLLRRASAPDRVRVTIVDNRSANPETAALLVAFQSRGMDVLAMDEPFNWSRANNLAASASRESTLVFVNNDTEMLTDGWDDVVLGYLQRPDVGAVGARLLYPDRTIQHAGVLFLEGSPRHEGVGAPVQHPGPFGRWEQTRAVGAVTGAFLATNRATFEAIGGFDERRLAIAFNDIDFCLHVRTRGLSILYAPAVELIHAESKTRGFNDTQAKVAWDLGEFQTLSDRWSQALEIDPGYNPQWTSGPVAFDGLRVAPTSEILAHIIRSAMPNPWMILPRT